MAAPKGNQFWKLAPSIGKNKIFESPEVLWNACVEYFEATDHRKWIKKEFHGKDAVECNVELKTPYTKSGLCVFLGIDFVTWENYRTKEGYEDFFNITAHVDKIIETQQFEGATVGAFNANIIARKLGLSENQNVTVVEQPLLDDISE